MGRATKQEYWFKARRYGWGWTPVTWQGWSLLALYMLVLAASAILLLTGTKDKAMNFVGVVAFIMIALSSTLLLIGVCLRKGEKPGWNWGTKKEKP